jgi:cardiolipin synthase
VLAPHARPLRRVARDGTPASLTVADWLSVVRLPLGVVFVFVAGRLPWAMGVLLAAGVSDVLDGWAARRLRDPADQGPHRGDWLDPFCDKIFVGAVLLGIYLTHRPPAALLLLIITRELLQVSMLAVYKAVPSLRRGPAYDFKANVLGKATTVLQFLTTGLLLLDQPVARPLAMACAALGLCAVAVYLNRLRLLRRPAT